jgi:hypothetical protein
MYDLPIQRYRWRRRTMRQRSIWTFAATYCLALQCIAQTTVDVNIEDGLIYPVGYTIELKCSGCSAYLNGTKLDDGKPEKLSNPGLYSLEIIDGEYAEARIFEVVDFVPLTASGAIVELIEQEKSTVRIGVLVKDFKVDTRFILQQPSPEIQRICIAPVFTLYSIDTLNQYYSAAIYSSGHHLLVYFDVPKEELANRLFAVGMIYEGDRTFVLETDFLPIDLTHKVTSDYFPAAPYCPGDGECRPRCTWRSKVVRHDKQKLDCLQGNPDSFPFHGARITGVSEGRTMHAEGLARDTIPGLAAFCTDAATGLYERLVFHVNLEPRCPCLEQTITATMNPTFVACAERGGLSALYWLSYAEAGGWLSATVAGIGSARAEGGVHVGGDGEITIGGENGVTITLSPAPPGSCKPFGPAQPGHGSASLSSTLVSCSSGTGITVYAEGALGGLATLFTKATAKIKNASCNVTLILQCPCCGPRVLRIN